MDFHEEPACLQLAKTTYTPLHTHAHIYMSIGQLSEF
jgi:hypothetical protein